MNDGWRGGRDEWVCVQNTNVRTANHGKMKTTSDHVDEEEKRCAWTAVMEVVVRIGILVLLTHCSMSCYGVKKHTMLALLRKMTSDVDFPCNQCS